MTESMSDAIPGEAENLDLLFVESRAQVESKCKIRAKKGQRIIFKMVYLVLNFDSSIWQDFGKCRMGVGMLYCLNLGRKRLNLSLFVGKSCV